MWYAERRLVTTYFARLHVFLNALQGPARIRGVYAYQTMIKSVCFPCGIDHMFTISPRTSSMGILPLGSDFPVEGINPLLGFYAAISRLSVSGDSPHGSQGW